LLNRGRRRTEQAKEVTLQTYGKDKYGRILADVFLLDGTNVNHTLVKDGWCWWYRKYAPGAMVLKSWRRGAGFRHFSAMRRGTENAGKIPPP
jgi:endonuclease YncB( thermonuclease family)